MGNTAKRMLAGFAIGALGSLQRTWETKRAEEAQRLRDERLAQIAEASQVRGFEFQAKQQDDSQAHSSEQSQLTREFQGSQTDKQMTQARELAAMNEAGANARHSASIGVQREGQAIQQQQLKERGELYTTSDGGNIRITNDAEGDRMLIELQKRGVTLTGKMGYADRPSLMGEGAGMLPPGGKPGAPKSNVTPFNPSYLKPPGAK